MRNTNLILQRINDVDDRIRIAIYDCMIFQNIKFKNLKMDQFLFLISNSVRNRNATVLSKFYEYSKQAIVGNMLEGLANQNGLDSNEVDIDSAQSLEIFLHFVETFDHFDFKFLAYYPKYHSDIRLFLRENLKRLGTSITCKILEQLCKNNMKKDKISSCSLINLMLIEIILNLIYKPNPNLGEKEESEFTQLKSKISEYFCSHLEYSSAI